MSHITTHVLDTSLGRPAAGIPVTLADSAGAELGSGITDADGRIASLGPDALPAGAFRLTFDTAAYFAASGTPTFFPRIVIEFELSDAVAHHHVPVLLSPFAYSTYRGS